MELTITYKKYRIYYYCLSGYLQVRYDNTVYHVGTIADNIKLMSDRHIVQIYHNLQEFAFGNMDMYKAMRHIARRGAKIELVDNRNVFNNK